jgi:general secretion pathway protein A
VYKDFYHLKNEPFCLTPDPHFVYLTQQHREALSGLVYSVLSRPGLTLLIGEAGTGKTTLLYTLRMLLEKRQYCVTLCVNPMLEPAEFYDFLLSKLLGRTPPTPKSQQLLALEQVLRENHANNRSSILMIDEAHRLPLGLLEEIRLLLNLETPREKLLEIILAGQPELSDVFRRPDLRQLKQRVSYVCRLNPLSSDELREYIRHRLSRAGCEDTAVFPEASIRAIYHYTSGIPRLVNTLCDNCLQIGYALQARQISEEIIQEAARDLDLLHGYATSQTGDVRHVAQNPFLAESAISGPDGGPGLAPQKNGGGAETGGKPERKGLGLFARVAGRR